MKMNGKTRGEGVAGAEGNLFNQSSLIQMEQWNGIYFQTDDSKGPMEEMMTHRIFTI
jgi:hypothetical protein